MTTFPRDNLFILLLLASTASGTTPSDLPKLSMYDSNYHASAAGQTTATVGDDLETYFYSQTLDHFNYRPESYATFRQRYVISSKHWGGIGSPIFVLLGAEVPFSPNSNSTKGFVVDFASRFNSLLVYIEHRYYGESIPFRSREEAFSNASTLGYFNSQQAIADYAEIIIHVKEQFNTGDSPVIVVGGSYGGMLASWFRLKYPHIAIGALASSAPILYFDDITPQDGYYNVVTKDFMEASQTCYQTIRNSWASMDEMASKPDGLSILSQKFKTCIPLKDVSLLKSVIRNMYANAAQYNTPPMYPVNQICKAIDDSDQNIHLAKYSPPLLLTEGKKLVILINQLSLLKPKSAGHGSEMVMPIGFGNLSTLFDITNAFNLTRFTDHCKSSYGVPPRPHWVTTYYGGHSIRRVLKRFGSNIIFSNGLKDPYSSGGVLEDISDTIHAVHTINGSHCLDLYPSSGSDPDWLISQREAEINIIQGWLLTYYKDLQVA